MKRIDLVSLLCHFIRNDMDRTYLQHMRILAWVSEEDLGNELDIEFIEQIAHTHAFLCISDMNSSHKSEKEFLGGTFDFKLSSVSDCGNYRVVLL